MDGEAAVRAAGGRCELRYAELHHAAAGESRADLFSADGLGGETASDVGFAQLDDDEKPDVAIGRVPARDAEQVRVFVEKTIAYEKNAPTGEWRSRVLAVADGQEPRSVTRRSAFSINFTAAIKRAWSIRRRAQRRPATEIVRDLNDGQRAGGLLRAWQRDAVGQG